MIFPFVSLLGIFCKNEAAFEDHVVLNKYAFLFICNFVWQIFFFFMFSCTFKLLGG